MKLASILLFVCMSLRLRAQRKAFVNPQSECRIECLNGGFCAYLVDDPAIHTCLCLLDLYYGDRCQYKVVHTIDKASTTQIITQDISETKTKEQVESEIKELEDEYAGEWESYEEEEYPEDGQERSQIEKLDNLVDNQSIQHSIQRKSDEMPNDAEYFEKISSEIRTEDAFGKPMNEEKSKSEYPLSSKASLSKLEQPNPNLIPDGESEYHGWMMSKRRRIVHSGSSRAFDFPLYVSTLLLLRFIFYISF